MNKLVIIGNGFDLAHGLKTGYEDFFVWRINKLLVDKYNSYSDNLFSIENKLINRSFNEISTLEEFKALCKQEGLKFKPKYDFIKKLYEKSFNRWVDIETEYYNEIKEIYNSFEKNNTYDIKNVREINKCLDIIRSGLIIYLAEINNSNNRKLAEFEDIMFKDLGCIGNKEKVYFLNFNYTTTIENYSCLLDNSEIIYIHGHITNLIKNPIIFGYGDETDKYYEKIEDLNENEFTRHFKSFSYLTTDNYKKLFDFLNEANFNVYIMGHSCGISDRVLFKNIFNHSNFEEGEIKLYFYEFKNENGEKLNDFFQKTQELSRHFDINSKHKMRTKVVPLNKSIPLPQFIPQTNKKSPLGI